MQDRTVLVIAYYFPPMGLSGVQRITKFIKYLPENGWKPIVLTSSDEDFYAYDESLLEELPADLQIYRTAVGKKKPAKKSEFPSWFRQKIGRAVLSTFNQPDSKIKWKKPAFELGAKIIAENNIDVILATAPPFTDFLIARELSAKFDIPFVADYRDVWVDNPFHFYATPMQRNKSRRMEKEILTHASKVTVVTRRTKEIQLKKYPLISHNDILIIPHGFDRADFAPYRDQKPDPAKFTITHSGLFQDNRTPKYFFKALSNFLKNNPEAVSNLEAVFIGLMRKPHLKMIKRYGLEANVKCLGYCNHGGTISELLRSDVLWLMLNDDVRSPGKLFEYLGADKPILACVPDGVIRKIATDSKACIATDPTDVAAIETAIGSFYTLWKKHNLPKPSKDYCDTYDRRTLTETMAKALSLAIQLI